MSLKLSSPETREFWEIPVLYQDDHLLALDKPAGLLTASDRWAPGRPSLSKLLQAGIAAGKPWALSRNLSYLAPAHRLEAETSGALLLARSKTVLAGLANLFGSEKPVKHFLVLVEGVPPQDRFEVNAKIGFHTTDTSRYRIEHQRGKRSLTRFEVLERFKGWTLLRCEMITDRPHQVRLHSQFAGLRVVADPLYGRGPLLLSALKPNYRLKPNRTERPLLSRPAVHSERLTFEHPVTGQPLEITAPLPKDLTVALKYLRQFAPP